MIDVCCMEVYIVCFDVINEWFIEVVFFIVVVEIFQEELDNGILLIFFGNGVEKCKKVFLVLGVIYSLVVCLVVYLILFVLQWYEVEQFEDVAYYRLFYFKLLNVIKLKKKLF